MLWLKDQWLTAQSLAAKPKMAALTPSAMKGRTSWPSLVSLNKARRMFRACTLLYQNIATGIQRQKSKANIIHALKDTRFRLLPNIGVCNYFERHNVLLGTWKWRPWNTVGNSTSSMHVLQIFKQKYETLCWGRIRGRVGGGGGGTNDYVLEAASKRNSWACPPAWIRHCRVIHEIIFLYFFMWVIKRWFLEILCSLTNILRTCLKLKGKIANCVPERCDPDAVKGEPMRAAVSWCHGNKACRAPWVLDPIRAWESNMAEGDRFL